MSFFYFYILVFVSVFIIATFFSNKKLIYLVILFSQNKLKMKREEVESKLRKYHTRLFSKRTGKNSEAANDNEFDAFEILRTLSKRNDCISRLKTI